VGCVSKGVSLTFDGAADEDWKARDAIWGAMRWAQRRHGGAVRNGGELGDEEVRDVRRRRAADGRRDRMFGYEVRIYRYVLYRYAKGRGETELRCVW
jgi:hypothetical protein